MPTIARYKERFEAIGWTKTQVIARSSTSKTLGNGSKNWRRPRATPPENSNPQLRKTGPRRNNDVSCSISAQKIMEVF